MSNLAEALRIVGEYARSTGTHTAYSKVVSEWCADHAEQVSKERSAYLMITDQIRRSNFSIDDIGPWNEDERAEFGELCRREVERQFGPCQPLPEKADPS